MNVFPVSGDQSYVNLLLNNPSNYRNNSQNTSVHLNPYIRLTPLKGLTFESRLGISLSYSKSNRFDGIGSYQYYRANPTADGYGFGRVIINYNRGANMNGFYVVDATGQRTILVNRTRCPNDAKKVHTAQFGVEPGHTYYVLSSDRLSARLHSIGFTANNSEKYYTSSTTGIQTVSASKAQKANDAMYNLAGQKVGKDFKGLVIVNGKKMMNK